MTDGERDGRALLAFTAGQSAALATLTKDTASHSVPAEVMDALCGAVHGLKRLVLVLHEVLAPDVSADDPFAASMPKILIEVADSHFGLVAALKA